MRRRTTILLLCASAAVAVGIAAFAWDDVAGRLPRSAETTAALIARLDDAGPTSRPSLLELERRAIRGVAPREEMADILRALWQPRVTARPIVRVGDHWPISWDSRRLGSTNWNEQYGGKPTTAPPWGAEERLVSLTIDGNDVPFRHQRFHRSGLILPSGYFAQQVAPSTVGEKVARATIEFRYYGDEAIPPLDLRDHRDLAPRPPKEFLERPFAIAWQRTIDIPVKVLPAGTEEDIERVIDPTRREAMAAAIAFRTYDRSGMGQLTRRLTVRREGSQFRDLSRIQITTLPVAIAADLVIRNPKTGEELIVREISLREGRTQEADMLPNRADAQKIDAWGVRTLDVIFRPSVSAARKSVDITRMWNEEIVLKDVPVDHPDQPATRPVAR